MTQKVNELDQLITTMIQVWRAIGRQRNHLVHDRGKTMLQSHLLHLIDEVRVLTLSELADRISLSLSATSQIVDRMVKADLLHRYHSEEDRRVVCVELTEVGKERLAEFRHARQEYLKDIFSHVPKKDIKELIRINTNLIKALESKG